MGQGGGVLFLIAKKSQNSIDNVLVLYTRNDPDGTTAAAANLNVDIEYSLEPWSTGHCRMSLGGQADFRIGNRLHTFAAFGWSDQPTRSMIRSEDAMVSREVDAGFRH